MQPSCEALESIDQSDLQWKTLRRRSRPGQLEKL
jgi:hypothetical protein